MMNVFISFIALFYSDDLFQEDFWIMLVVLYATAGFYLVDFYQLIKRRSMAENMSMMVLPCLFSVIGASLATMSLSVPAVGTMRIRDFAMALQQGSLYGALAFIYLIYILIWIVTLWSQKKRRRSDVKRWILSCVPDYIFIVFGLVCCIWYFFFGNSIFESFGERLLWLYLYSLYLLLCKLVLLILALFERLYSLRLTMVRWKPWKNTTFFLWRYFLLYQNPIFRNIVLFEGGILAFLTVLLNGEGWEPEMIGVMAFLYVAGVFVILAACKPVIKGMERFRNWGEICEIRTLFCKEYFTEDHIFDGNGYALTRNFLVDHNHPVAVYYLPMLQSTVVRADEKGTCRYINFTDGEQCRIEKEEFSGIEPMIAYLQKQLASGPMKRPEQPSKIESNYQRLVMTLAVIVILAMMLMSELI